MESRPITQTHPKLLNSRFGLHKTDPCVADFTQKEVQAFTVDIDEYWAARKREGAAAEELSRMATFASNQYLEGEQAALAKAKSATTTPVPTANTLRKTTMPTTVPWFIY